MELFPELGEEEGELVALNWLNLVMCVGASFVTVAIGQLGLFGFTSTQQVSDLYPTLIKTPPWVMSSIVLILTVALLVWATAQIFPAFRVKARDGVNHYYVAAALFQIVWVIMCSYQLLFISLFASLALLVFLGLILRDQGKQVTLDGTTEFLIHKFPFVCYFGLGVYVILWNLCIVLVDANVSMNAQYWVALLSLVAMSLASFTSILCDKAEYTIPTLMAYFTIGISVELSNPDGQLVLSFGQNRIDAVRITALLISSLAIAVMACRALMHIVCTHKHRHQRGTDEERPSSGTGNRLG